MMLLAVLASLVALAASQKPGCCTPAQWEGVEGTEGGYTTTGRDDKPIYIEGYTFVSYDADNQRVAAATNTSYNGRSFAVKAIYDFKKGKRYYVYEKKCRSMDLKADFRKACIPKKAKLGPSFYFGAGDKTLKAKNVRFPIKKDTLRAEVTVTMAEGCIPLGENFHGHYMRKGKGRRPIMASFLEVIGFVNITPGIKDPAVFTPPKSCKEVTDFEEPEVFSSRHFRLIAGF